MAEEAHKQLGDQISAGIVITKYGHAKGPIGNLAIREAGHPVPDENGFLATEEAMRITDGLTCQDNVLLLLSGGGSALFEMPLIDKEELQSITEHLLKCGASIDEINTIRKRLSAVKGGRFAEHCAPAHVFAIVLSDVIGDRLDVIASGPACPDRTTTADAEQVWKKYALPVSPKAERCLMSETPKMLSNVETCITGSVRELCRAAADACRQRGYTPVLLTDELACEAREAGAFLAAIARTHQNETASVAYLAGGETVVHVTGKGKGGRNQELALGAAEGIAGLRGTAVCSVGSDGTDGPTDAAGGYVDGDTKHELLEQNIQIHEVLADNNAYPALHACGGLVVTGPTGTNVNDVAILLIRR